MMPAEQKVETRNYCHHDKLTYNRLSVKATTSFLVSVTGYSYCHFERCKHGSTKKKWKVRDGREHQKEQSGEEEASGNAVLLLLLKGYCCYRLRVTKRVKLRYCLDPGNMERCRKPSCKYENLHCAVKRMKPAILFCFFFREAYYFICFCMLE